jgi:uncharacterized integral membrane protein
MSRIRLGAGIGGLGLLIIFLLQNLQTSTVHFLWFDWEVRTVFALLAAAICGALASMLFGFFRRRARRSERRDARRDR